MNFQQFVTTEFGTRLWRALGRWLPLPVGRALGRAVTGILWRRRHSSLYRILYANQAGVLGPWASPEEIHRAVGAVLQHAGMTAFDLMYLAARGDAAIQAAVDFGPAVMAEYHAARATGRGVLICGGHLSNFNLGFLALASKGIPLQVLSSARPVGGFQVMHEMRARGLIKETPIDGPALREAIAYLRQGGVALTGADWRCPVPPEERLPFFGRPANLPTGHIRLAISTNALILPVTFRWSPERGYYAQLAPAMELELTGDRAADVRHNALRVLAVLEKWIAEAPEQWLMYHPVWPEDDGEK